MTFSMKLPAGKGKKKPLATSLMAGTTTCGLVLSNEDTAKKEVFSSFNAFAAATEEKHTKKTEEEDQEGSRRQVGAEAAAARSLQQRQVDKLRTQALVEDASVFYYDEVYDEMKSARESKASAQAVKRELEKKKPKYISTLLQQAKIREVENERMRERRLLHERNTDDVQYGDKEKLVSASYKRKLQEMQKWDAEDARLAAMEEQEDVTKQGEDAMAGFYVNLKKNIAMGGTTANARSAYTAKETRYRKTGNVDPARAEQGHERDGVDEPEVVKTCDETPTKKVRSGTKQDDYRSSPTSDALPKLMDVHETNALLPIVDKLEEPRLSKEDVIAAARVRFLNRKTQRRPHLTNN